MIFDSPRLELLRRKYKGVPSFRAPAILHIARLERLAGERQYLEMWLAKAPDEKRTDWLKRLTSEDDGQHWGAWFEVMLFGWLSEVGLADANPGLEGADPDFLVHIEQHSVAIEARAILRSAEDRERDKLRYDVHWYLKTIQRPFLVVIEDAHLIGGLVESDFISAVTTWLDKAPVTTYCYRDARGNALELTAQPYPRSRQVVTIGHGDGSVVNPDFLKPAIRKKARQHSKIRRSSVPYVIALFLQAVEYSAEEVVEAWFSKMAVVMDTDKLEVVGERLDGSGLHFLGREVRHRTVSGTLVFHANLSGDLNRRELVGWYVQNPYAHNLLPPTLFHVQSYYSIVKRDSEHYHMGWYRQ